MTSYKVAFIKTNAFKKKVVGKNYYEGYDNQVEGSVPIYPFYFTEDYSRSWDSGNTFSYSSLRNGEIESIDYDSSKLTVKFLNYDAFSYEEIVYEVGVPTTDEKIVDPSDHSKLFPFTPTEILVANSLNSGEPIIESLRESIMEFEQNKGKIPKMAETFEAEDNSFNWGDTGLEEHFVFVQFIPKRDRQIPTHVIYRYNPTETGMRKKTMCGIYLKGKNADFNVGWPNHLPLHPEHKSGGCKKCYEIMSNMLNKKSAETFGAELDEIQDDVAIVRNRMGDAVGNIDLNDYDVEGVSIEIYNDKGVLLEEIVLGSETFGAESFKDKTYTDGNDFTWRLVSQKYAKQNWRNEEIYWLDTSNDTESLIDESNYEKYTSPDFSDELFGMEIGFEAETFEARTHRKSYDWRNKKFVKRPDGKHNPGNIRGYEHSPRGTPDSKLDYDSANKANARIKANIKGKEDLRDSINFEANAKSGDKVYIITRRCEDYSAYRELDLAVFSSLTEARKKFNYLFKEEKENYYADETIADAKDYMNWGQVGWGIESFMADDMIYELREQTIGNNAMSGFYFDAESHGKMNWTLNYNDYPNCCPFHQKYTDVMSNSMPCGDILWGQGFSVDIEGTQYDIWGHEVND